MPEGLNDDPPDDIERLACHFGTGPQRSQLHAQQTAARLAGRTRLSTKSDEILQRE
jgi:hypothetical protein